MYLVPISTDFYVLYSIWQPNALLSKEIMSISYAGIRRHMHFYGICAACMLTTSPWPLRGIVTPECVPLIDEHHLQCWSPSLVMKHRTAACCMPVNSRELPAVHVRMRRVYVLMLGMCSLGGVQGRLYAAQRQAQCNVHGHKPAAHCCLCCWHAVLWQCVVSVPLCVLHSDPQGMPSSAVLILAACTVCAGP